MARAVTSRSIARAVASSSHSGGRVDAHAAGVGAAVAVEDGLVIAAERHVRDGRAVGEGVGRGLRAVQALLDEHARAGLAERAPAHREVDGGEGLGGGVADRDALAGGQPLGLDHARAVAGEAAHVLVRRLDLVEGDRAAGRDAGARHQLLGERLRGLDLGRGARGPEDRDALGGEAVGDAGRERILGRDDDEVGAQPLRRRDDGLDVGGSELGQVLAEGGGAGVAGAVQSAPKPGDWASFQAMACSRPSPPRRRMLVLIAAPRRIRCGRSLPLAGYSHSIVPGGFEVMS